MKESKQKEKERKGLNEGRQAIKEIVGWKGNTGREKEAWE